MLWAIDVGNTHTVVGLWYEGTWITEWRISTQIRRTEDELASMFLQLAQADGVRLQASEVIVASVVPGVNDSLTRFAAKWLKCTPTFIVNGTQVGLEVNYNPAAAVGADRIVNALAGKAKYGTPLVIVDFGTATTFDAIDRQGVYSGGAILPGLQVSLEALVSRTAKLPQIELSMPRLAVGTSTPESLQSGLMLGYVGAVNAVARQVQTELGGGRIVATGGLGELFAVECETIELYDATLTLDGLIAAHRWIDLNRR